MKDTVFQYQLRCFTFAIYVLFMTSESFVLCIMGPVIVKRARKSDISLDTDIM